ncbi:MAG: hypothetical protein ACK5EW_01555 [Bacteroidota bacterium]|jgi:hypothetical protein
MPIKRYNGSDWEVVAGAGVQGPTGATGASATTVVTTKGDLLGYSTTADRLAVGNNGETLVADSSATTGLRYQTGVNGNYIINGGCDIWQRGTTWTGTGYSGADRWYAALAGTVTVSQETSDLPTGVGVQYGMKYVTGASSSYAQFYTALETATVKPMRGQTFVVSYYLKTAGSYAGGVILSVDYSTSTDALTAQTTNIATLVTTGSTATSWTRVQQSFTVPSTAVGLRVGILPDTVQASGVTVRIAAIQLELGTVPTTFKRSGGTIQGELDACQRYYWRQTGTTYSVGFAKDTFYAYTVMPHPVRMRVNPTLETTGTASNYLILHNATSFCSSVPSLTQANPDCSMITYTVAGGTLTTGQANLCSQSGASTFIGFSAEL